MICVLDTYWMVLHYFTRLFQKMIGEMIGEMGRTEIDPTQNIKPNTWLLDPNKAGAREGLA